jgi:hypothetical protein
VGYCKKAHKAEAEIEDICTIRAINKAYPSNLTWKQWLLIEDLFRKLLPGDRPRTVTIYAVVNAIFYVLCQGCTLRALPRDFLVWSTVNGYFRKWRKDVTHLESLFTLMGIGLGVPDHSTGL